VLAELIPISNYKVRELNFVLFAEYCADFKGMIALWLYKLLNDKRLISHLNDLIQEMFEIITVNNVSFAPCFIFRK
jgi:hypothetical protein